MSDALLILADYGGHMDDWGPGWWIAMGLMMIVFWGLVIAGGVWLVRTLMAERHGNAGEKPIDLLERRLANGEVSPEEYRERREVLLGARDRQ